MFSSCFRTLAVVLVPDFHFTCGFISSVCRSGQVNQAKSSRVKSSQEDGVVLHQEERLGAARHGTIQMEYSGVKQ